jgi:hypothetical protein
MLFSPNINIVKMTGPIGQLIEPSASWFEYSTTNYLEMHRTKLNWVTTTQYILLFTTVLVIQFNYKYNNI